MKGAVKINESVNKEYALSYFTVWILPWGRPFPVPGCYVLSLVVTQDCIEVLPHYQGSYHIILLLFINKLIFIVYLNSNDFYLVLLMIYKCCILVLKVITLCYTMYYYCRVWIILSGTLATSFSVLKEIVTLTTGLYWGISSTIREVIILSYCYLSINWYLLFIW
jgi:hypothetical protein